MTVFRFTKSQVIVINGYLCFKLDLAFNVTPILIYNFIKSNFSTLSFYPIWQELSF